MIIYTTGTFDLLHIGHINLFKRCAYLAGEGGKVFVGVSTNEAYEAHKGKSPIQSWEERSAVVQSISYVDEVFRHDQRTFKDMLYKLKPNLVVKGTDWVDKDIYGFYNIEKHELDLGLIYVPYTKGISSTLLKRGYEL